MENSDTSYSSYHSSWPKRVADFQRLAQTIGTNIQKMSQNATSMQRMVNQLGTPQDSTQLRNELHQIQNYTGLLAKDTNKYIKELNSLTLSGSTPEMRQWKMQKEKLTNEFTSALNSFQNSQRLIAHKEKESFKRARANSGLDSPFARTDEPRSPDPLIELDQPRHVQTQLQMEEDVDLQMLQEREEAIHQLESDIVDVNTIFKDLASMVHDQGEVIDSIEANVESGQVHVSEGVQQLSKARDYQTKARKKKFVILLIVMIVVAVLIGIIIWQAS